MARESIKASFDRRASCWARTHGSSRIETLYPNEHFSVRDVAFGLLKNGEFLSADQFASKLKEQVGYVAHITMLVDRHYAKGLDDLHPSVDYVARGIVKADLNQDVLFWETPEELLRTPEAFDILTACLRELLERKLTRLDCRVYGSGTGATLSLGTVQQILE